MLISLDVGGATIDLRDEDQLTEVVLMWSANANMKFPSGLKVLTFNNSANGSYDISNVTHFTRLGPGQIGIDNFKNRCLNYYNRGEVDAQGNVITPPCIIDEFTVDDRLLGTQRTDFSFLEDWNLNCKTFTCGSWGTSKVTSTKRN